MKINHVRHICDGDLRLVTLFFDKNNDVVQAMHYHKNGNIAHIYETNSDKCLYHDHSSGQCPSHQ